MQESNSLSLLSNANRMLAEVKTIDDAKQLMDMAAAAKLYAQKHKLSKEAVEHATEIETRAERKVGEYIIRMKENDELSKGTQGQLAGKESSGTPLKVVPEEAVKLEDIGISYNLSSESQALAKMDDVEFEKVATSKKTKKKAVQEVRQRTIKAEKKETPPLKGKYRIIYADPPWCYGDKRDGRTSGAEDHYPTMTISELCELKIKDITEKDAVLFMWVTSPLLEECFEVIKAWGFKYKTSFVWDKIKHNMGHYNSVRHELLLICTKGSCLPDNNKLYDSVVSIERSDKHSEKPEEFRNIIDDLYNWGERIELFSRKRIENWNIWGNEI